MVAFLFLMVADALEKYRARHAEEHQKISQYKAETNEQYSDNCLKEPVSIVTAFKCLINSVDANREAQRSNYDLRAQQEMARWAYVIALLTIGSLVISSGGLIALLISLNQTRTAIGNTREIGEAQTRAYLTCTGAEYEVWSDHIFITVLMENKGQSPASKVRLEATATLAKWKDNANPGDRSLEEHELQTISEDCEMIQAGVKGEGSVEYTRQEIGDQWHNLLHKSGLLVGVHCQITWTDVFDKPQTFTVYVVDDNGGKLTTEGGRRVRRGKMYAFGAPD